MQVEEGGIKRLILLGSTIVILTTTIAVSFFLITTENKNFQIEVQRIEKELITNRKRNIENRLQSLLNEINFDQIFMREIQLDELKNFTNTLHVSLQDVSKNSLNSIKKLLEKHDTDDTMHGFAFFENGTIFWNPRNPKTVGKNFLNAQDINDQFYIKDMIKVAKSGRKDTSVTFSWYIPNETTISTNISYIRYLPKLNLIIGAYRSEESINRWIQATILKKINTHTFWKDSLFFIDYLQSYTMKDEFLKPLLRLGNATYLKALQSPQTQQKIGDVFLSEGFVGKHTLNTTFNSQQYLFYTTILPKWRWVIGIGENLQELTAIKNAQLKRTKTNRDIKIMQLGVLALFIACLFLILSKYLAQAIENLLLNYRQRADMEADKYQALYQHSNDSFLLAKEENLKIIDANPKALHITVCSKDELKQTSLDFFFPALNFQKIKNQDSGYERTEFINKDNERKTVEFTFVWILLQNQKIIFVSIRDITERMKLVSERRQQEQLLIQQSKMAAMGEMLGNIAHQWRQPLSQLSGLFMDLESAYSFGELNKKYIKDSVSEADDIIEYMSSTIDDFRNFFNPNKTKENFLVSKALTQAIKIIQSSFQSYDISLHVIVKDELPIYGYENEYAQVILNLLSNAKDILLQRKTQNPRVDISIFVKDEKTHMSIQDNAGGIDEEIKTKIFEPYFTTKYTYGTGIGLYMSKVIIEKNMAGHIYVDNIDEGARFTISI